MFKENNITQDNNLELRKNELFKAKHLLDDEYLSAFDEREKFYNIELYKIYQYAKKLSGTSKTNYFASLPHSEKELLDNYNNALEYQKNIIDPITNKIKSIQAELGEINKQETENYQKAFQEKKEALLKSLYSNLDATYNKIPKSEIDSGMTTENSLKSHPEIASEAQTLEYYISKIENEISNNDKLSLIIEELKLRKILN